MPALTLPALAMAAVVAGGRRPPYGVRRTTASWFPRGIAVTALVCLGLVGVGLAVSQRDVDTAVAAVHDGRCETAETAARSALGLDGQRPEAYQVLAVCAARAGDPTTALDQMRQALALDPDNWRLVYDVAVLQGLQGRDPRPTLRAARRLNPRSWFLRIAARPFNGNTPQVWQAAARQADLLV
jgi:tetratricopeptide (TPR) repeat protein